LVDIRPDPGAGARLSLERLFSPRSLAIVGASSNPDKIGGIPLRYACGFGFAGDVYPVNPNAQTVQGMRAWPSLAAIGQPIDLAVLAVPAAAVESAVADAAAAGVANLIVFSSGFAETGADGEAAQQRIARACRDAGIRMLGPNCLGVMNVRRHLYATFSPAPASGLVEPGRIALASQSGAFGAYAYAMARERGIGLSLWATTGNEADLQLADCLDWMARDPDTDVVMVYMEGCRDGARLCEAFEAARERGKTVVAIKVGSTGLGAQAAASHTAALAGDERVYDAVFRRHGVIRARTITDFFGFAHAAATAGRPRRASIGLFTVSGGVGALMADDAQEAGLDVPALSEATQQSIKALVPFAATRNPLDITGQVTSEPGLLTQAADLMLADGQYGSWIAFMAAGGASDKFWPTLERLMRGLRDRYPQTVLALCTLLAPARRRELEAQGVLVFADPTDAIRTLGVLSVGDQRAAGTAAPGEDDRPDGAGRGKDIGEGKGIDAQAIADAADQLVAIGTGAMSEAEALRVLARAGVPVVPHEVVTDENGLDGALSRIAPPFVLKIVSRDIAHKSDVGGVALDVRDAAQARRVFTSMRQAVRARRPDARIDGVLVAPMVGGGIECLVGVHRDPVFGLVLMFGLGGIHVELLDDVSVRPLPISRREALAMIGEIRGSKVLAGSRGQAPVDRDALADLLGVVAALAERIGERLNGLELNPVLARPAAEGGCVVLDALLTIGESHGTE